MSVNMKKKRYPEFIESQEGIFPPSYDELFVDPGKYYIPSLRSLNHVFRKPKCIFPHIVQFSNAAKPDRKYNDNYKNFAETITVVFCGVITGIPPIFVTM